MSPIQVSMLKLDPGSRGRRFGLWDLTRPAGQSLQGWDWCPYKDLRLFLPLCHLRTPLSWGVGPMQTCFIFFHMRMKSALSSFVLIVMLSLIHMSVLSLGPVESSVCKLCFSSQSHSPSLFPSLFTMAPRKRYYIHNTDLPFQTKNVLTFDSMFSSFFLPLFISL